MAPYPETASAAALDQGRPDPAGRALAIGCGLIALALLALPPLAFSGQVDLVLSGGGEPYTSLADSLEARLSASPGARDLRVIRTQTGKTAHAGGADLRVGVGMKACESLLTGRSSQPALCALVPREGFERLERAAPGRRISAIYLDQPISRQLALARALLPDARRLGLLAGPDLQREAGEIRRQAHAAGFLADIQPADDEREAIQGIQRLVTRNDLLLAAYDSQVLTPSTAKWLLNLAYKQGLPVLGFSRSYLDAGAVAAVYSTPEQIGRQTAEAIAHVVGSGSGRLPPSAYPRYFDVGVNRAVARTLGLAPPDDAELSRRVERLERDTP
jgi:ABC-type uncharacterized transport system substrate-binding protein